MNELTTHADESLTYEEHALRQDTMKEVFAATAKAMLALGRRTCPRCGKEKLNPNGARNALSRRADIIICDDCGTAEALNDCCGHPDYMSDWWIAGVIEEIRAILNDREPCE